MTPRIVTMVDHSKYTLKPKKVKKLFRNAGSFRNRCILKLLALCGLRRFEVAKLRVESLDLERGRLEVVGKGNKKAVVPLPEDLADDIEHYLDGKREGWLFPSPEKDEHISSRQINRIVKKAGEKAGLNNPNPDLKNINPHILRHSCARILKNEGASLETVQKVMRHASYKTTMDLYGTKSVDEVQKEYREKMSL